MLAELTYSCDQAPGIRRVRVRERFVYQLPTGRVVRAAADLDRIRKLAIPPAWTDVWVCPDAAGHIQATGRDARGRKQYRYHPDWRAARDESKFGLLLPFARALPRLRACVAADLGRPGLPREKVLAAVARLLDVTHLRVGNAEYARSNKSFGLSTLQDRHARIDGGTVRLRFRGKSGVWHDRAVTDRRLARIVRRCRDLPGQHLFQYEGDDGGPRPVGSVDVNDYLRAAAAGPFTAKVFRTWAGTVRAAALLAEEPTAETKTAAARTVAEVIRRVAAELGNTPAVCRKSYVHPAVTDAWLAGELPRAGRAAGLSADETRVVRLLKRPEGGGGR